VTHESVLCALSHHPQNLQVSETSEVSEREALLVWTTTPWTLTSNVAAAVGPELDYLQVKA
jgi:isoleucyl-tRNA synthetase